MKALTATNRDVLLCRTNDLRKGDSHSINNREKEK